MNDTNYKAMSYGEVLIANLIIFVPLLIMWIFGIFDLAAVIVLALILVAVAFTQAERLQCVEKPVALVGGEPALDCP